MKKLLIAIVLLIGLNTFASSFIDTLHIAVNRNKIKKTSYYKEIYNDENAVAFEGKDKHVIIIIFDRGKIIGMTFSFMKPDRIKKTLRHFVYDKDQFKTKTVGDMVFFIENLLRYAVMYDFKNNTLMVVDVDKRKLVQDKLNLVSLKVNNKKAKNILDF